MKKITTRSQILSVAERWDRQYPSRRPDHVRDPIRKRLHELDKTTATAADVAAIIGNDSWTKCMCNECDQEVESVVEVGQEPDYESATATLCVTCLKKAAALMEEP